MASLKVVYYGEHPCQAFKRDGKACRNKAYYQANKQYVCGVHSQKGQRRDLPKNPQARNNREKELEEHKKGVKVVAEQNQAAGRAGHVTCLKMRMRHAVEFTTGYQNVFPNYNHGSRSDGLGMPSLSPMSMGPIEHKQPGLPLALNLENLHQSNKVFPDEVDADGQPTAQFYETQLAMYQDPVPHRHKETSHRQNKPLYSVWVTNDGQTLHLSYIESRQIYCHFYEQHAIKSSDLHKLRDMVGQGYNLQICGYDAYVPQIGVDGLAKSLEKHYLDSSRPFGHELVLYTLLTLDPADYPWRKHCTIKDLQE